MGHIVVDWVEFGDGELRIVGGDYGSITLEGTSDEARRTIDAIVGAARRGDNVVAHVVRFAHFYGKAVEQPTRHATAAGGAQDSATATKQSDGTEGSTEGGAVAGRADGDS